MLETEKPRLRGERVGMPSHLHLAHYGPGLSGYQSGARIVRQAQEQAGPESIRPGTAASKPAVTPAAPKSTQGSAGVLPIWGLKHDPQEKAALGGSPATLPYRRPEPLLWTSAHFRNGCVFLWIPDGESLTAAEFSLSRPSR